MSAITGKFERLVTVVGAGRKVEWRMVEVEIESVLETRC
jgi:hypothetical protein